MRQFPALYLLILMIIFELKTVPGTFNRMMPPVIWQRIVWNSLRRSHFVVRLAINIIRTESDWKYWDDIDKSLSNYQITNRNQLRAVILDIWSKCTVLQCTKLIESIPKRIKMVQKAHGGSITKYWPLFLWFCDFFQ